VLSHQARFRFLRVPTNSTFNTFGELKPLEHLYQYNRDFAKKLRQPL
jgi:hypothetical protein